MGLSRSIYGIETRERNIFFIELYKFFHTKHVFKSKSYIRRYIENEFVILILVGEKNEIFIIKV